MPFTFNKLRLDDVVVAKPQVFHDNRGFLLESYDAEEFVEHGIEEKFPLEFYSKSKKGVIRGLHFQRPPHSQAKLVHCFIGEVFDVVVDVRPDSDTFGEYVTRTLSEENKEILYVPEGFAHGFATLSETAYVYYKASATYAPDHQGGIHWSDPDIGIEWPIDQPIISDRDNELPYLKDAHVDIWDQKE